MKNKIKELRRLNNMTQADLADLVDTTRQTIISIENGKYTASLPLAYKIAKVFNLQIEDVFDFSEVVS
ncbi:helix-turn-helix transcriptional regulator [Ligilactobacillus ceti]|nr:helix-turn-helix transcriptional regulator [Ligilactobacillus ceti]